MPQGKLQIIRGGGDGVGNYTFYAARKFSHCKHRIKIRRKESDRKLTGETLKGSWPGYKYELRDRCQKTFLLFLLCSVRIFQCLGLSYSVVSIGSFWFRQFRNSVNFRIFLHDKAEYKWWWCFSCFFRFVQ